MLGHGGQFRSDLSLESLHLIQGRLGLPSLLSDFVVLVVDLFNLPLQLCQELLEII